MNIWIFQDEPGTDMFQKLSGRRENNVVKWNIERYFNNRNQQPIISKDDLVLFWQPGNDNSPAGIYGYGKVKDEPYEQKNEKSNYMVDVKAQAIFLKPVTRSEIINTRVQCLLDMQIIKMAGGHIVFIVTYDAFNALLDNFEQFISHH